MDVLPEASLSDVNYPLRVSHYIFPYTLISHSVVGFPGGNGSTMRVSEASCQGRAGNLATRVQYF
jgi:hypothetical protein